VNSISGNIDDAALYKIALQCARANAEGCTLACDLCQLNVYNYTSDGKEASLIKATAFSDYQLKEKIRREVETHETYRRAALLIPALLVILIISSIVQMCMPSKPTQVMRALPTAEENYLRTSMTRMFIDEQERRRKLLPIKDEIKWLKAHQNDVSNVPRILRVIHSDDMYDYDGDGYVDCCDYSKVFVLLYGQDAVLVHNKNKQVNMNHMFVRVFYNASDFMDIEPQCNYDSDYSMRAVWGDRYDVKCNAYW